MTQSERMKEEIKRAGLYEEGSTIYGGLVGKALDELIAVFTKQGHSGSSAPLVAGLFVRLVNGDVLSPLTGEPDEWIAEGSLFQNKRMFNVFAFDEHGKDAHMVSGRVFVEKSGASFTCRESSVPITFPCIPVKEYIHEGTPEAEPYKHLFAKDEKAVDDRD